MASLVRPWIVSYLDPFGRRVPKGTRDARKTRARAPKWYAQGVPGYPAKKRIPLAVDKQVAKKMLADLVAGAERGAAAMPDLAAAGQPLAALVVEFGQGIGRKATASHTATVLRDVRRVLAGCELQTVADLHAKDLAVRVEKFVWSLTEGEDGLTHPSAAYIGKHARQFTRWLWRKRKLLDFDPLAAVDLPSQDTATKRRAFAAEELAALIGVAERSDNVFRGLAGPDRAMLYLVAVSTGYRAAELAALAPSNVDLDGEVPVVRVKGRPTRERAGTKNRKDAEQPLPPAVAARLRAYLVGRPSSERIWPGTWYTKAARMIHRDMATAGVPVMADEERADFHSLRHSYTSLLARTAPVKVVQELSRHSTPMLTIGRYSHAGMKEKADAVSRLPLPGSGESAAPFAALSRAELERAAESLLAGFLVLLFAPPLAPTLGTVGNGEEPSGTESVALVKQSA